MASRTYLVTVDASDTSVELDSLKEFITTSSLFHDWWNHIPFVFLVTSDEDAGTISEALRRYTKDAKLLVMETNPAESEGLLPEQSWKWIRRQQRAQQRVPNTA